VYPFAASFRPAREEKQNMRTSLTLALAAAALALPVYSQTASGCSACNQKAETTATATIPGTTDSVPVGQIENLVPIAVVSVLGCETCAEKTVAWALQHGSSKEDIERALRTVAAMQKLDCFKGQFGPDAIARLEKPLAAARRALEQGNPVAASAH
jgi:hypothetical protein